MSDIKSCPVRGCTGTCKRIQVMCSRCWRLVPKGLQNTIWRLYQQDFGSSAHIAACDTAIDHVSRELQGRSNA